ncbi:hypothetical protein GCM10011588_29360 [Nocardia jinanensis]|uniref:Uncharacterized protein n=1 Tax=Nocardia jinanensis TaxID=382504 RepID=A0A917VTI3_9NOCA|nr:hypothetical protein GCM10011588_29360 [Nocardia jinanensis]
MARLRRRATLVFVTPFRTHGNRYLGAAGSSAGSAAPRYFRRMPAVTGVAPAAAAAGDRRYN